LVASVADTHTERYAYTIHHAYPERYTYYDAVSVSNFRAGINTDS
jgi:hypothetical protein